MRFSGRPLGVALCLSLCLIAVTTGHQSPSSADGACDRLSPIVNSTGSGAPPTAADCLDVGSAARRNWTGAVKMRNHSTPPLEAADAGRQSLIGHWTLPVSVADASAVAARNASDEQGRQGRGDRVGACVSGREFRIGYRWSDR